MTRDEMIFRLERLGPPKTRGGDPAAIADSALADRATLERVRPLVPGEKVLDFGCGYGRLGLAFVGTGVGYRGVDTDPGRLNYASDLLAGPDAEVHQHNARNGRYNPRGTAAHRLRFADGEFAAAFAVSVFTHICVEAVAAAYLADLARVLKPGGVLLSTWLTDADEAAVAEATDYRSYHQPTRVRDMIEAAGFEIVEAGGAGTVADHRTVLARRKP